MKTLKGDQQLRSVSLSCSVCAPGVRTQNPLHEEEGAWMQATIEASRRGMEKCFRLTSSLIG